MYEKPAFVLSMDTELAWGTIDKPESLRGYAEYYRKTRGVIDDLLVLLERYEMSATWAVVGHLFLDKCDRKNGVKHPEIRRSKASWYDCDWFDKDPCTNINEDPFYYGRDIVEKILRSRIKHEIASHSFSHIIFNNPDLKRETVEDELNLCHDLAKEYGISIESFVFPRNQEGFYKELKKLGIKSYRGIEKSWYAKYSVRTQKAFHILDQVFSMTPPVYLPENKYGLLNIPGSMLYLAKDGFRKYIPVSCRVNKAKKGIKKAIRENKIFHLWFHPFNLATDPDNLLNGLEKIFQFVKEEMLAVKTMRDISREYSLYSLQ